LGKKKKEVKNVSKDIEKYTKERDEVQNVRKNFWKENSSKTKEYKDWHEKLETSQNDLKHTMDRHMYAALREVRRFAEEKKIKGYYGPLIELFECPEEFRKCVETTAGNRLFQVVVDHDKTASIIIEHLKRVKAGRLTFMPLNRLRPSDPNYPSDTSEAVPMIEKLKFNGRYHKAMMQVFGKTLITRTLEIGARLSRSHGLNTITLDGDQVNKRGALTGGFIDERKSRIGAYESKKAAEGKLGKINEEKEAIEEQIQEQNQIEAKLSGQINKAYAEKRHLRNQYDQMQNDIKRLAKDRDLEISTKKNNETELARLKAEAAQLESQLESIQSELDSDLADELNSQDQGELERLTADTTELRSKLIEISNLRAEAESKKKILENDLSTNLTKRAEELRLELSSQSQEETTEEFTKEQDELRQLSEIISDFDEQIEEAEGTVDDATSRLNSLQGQLEKLKAKESNQEKRLETVSRDVEKFFTKRNNLIRRQQYCRKRIRDVGALARDDYTKHDQKSVKRLMDQLAKCNEKLKKFSHVNKKALDQYVNFTQQREELMRRKTELDEGGQAIHDLIKHLDQKKEEAIQRTFKGIAKHFSAVFKQLVPSGKGTLTIKKKEGDESKHNRSTANYAGVGIKVSFSGGSGFDRSVKGLSGGQQTIVALSLIFAIQRCDPSPFYLFDEIDANLDAVYRRSVAGMIREQCSTAQFITTTFRPELLEHANKFYGVAFQNKMSKVSVISRDDARDIISQVEKEL